MAKEPKYLSTARAELGEREVAGRGHNPRIVEYHASTELSATADEVPWCSSFVNWVMAKNEIAGTNSAMARSWTRWGTACEPQVGCVVVLRRGSNLNEGHVGFLLEWTDESVTLLGGNQGNSVSVCAYPRAHVVAFRKYKSLTSSTTLAATAAAAAATVVEKATQVAIDSAPAIPAAPAAPAVTPILEPSQVGTIMSLLPHVGSMVQAAMVSVVFASLMWVAYQRMIKHKTGVV